MSAPPHDSFQTGRRIYRVECGWKANGEHIEEDAGEPWVLMGKQMVLLTVFSGTLHVSAGSCPKLLSQTQKFTIKMG